MNELPETVTLAMRCSKVIGSNGEEIFDSLMAEDVTTATLIADRRHHRSSHPVEQVEPVPASADR